MPGEKDLGNPRDPEGFRQSPSATHPIVRGPSAGEKSNLPAGRPEARGSSDELIDLSVIIPALNEGPNIELLLPELTRILRGTVGRWEIVIVTGRADAQTLNAAAKSGAQVLEQTERGYGGALLAGFARARGRYVLTMDADLSHPPVFIGDMWRQRSSADLTIASRYVPGGKATMPLGRYVLSRILNLFFRVGFGLEVRDLSSGFRLYRREAVAELDLLSRDFDILQELLVRFHAAGRIILEVPFVYEPRKHGSSNAKLVRFGLAYLRTFWTLRKATETAAAISPCGGGDPADSAH